MRRLLLSITFFLAVSTSADEQTRLDYLLHCSGCHLPDGRGMLPEVPALGEALGIIVGLPGGRAYIAGVPAASQTPISDQSLADITNWVLHSFNARTLPDGFEPITAAEIHHGRRHVMKDPLKLRKEIWSHYAP